MKIARYVCLIAFALALPTALSAGHKNAPPDPRLASLAGDWEVADTASYYWTVAEDNWRPVNKRYHHFHIEVIGDELHVTRVIDLDSGEGLAGDVQPYAILKLDGRRIEGHLDKKFPWYRQWTVAPSRGQLEGVVSQDFKEIRLSSVLPATTYEHGGAVWTSELWRK